MNKITSALAIAGTVAFLGAGAAQAAPVAVPAQIAQYPADESGAVSAGTIAPGGTVVFTGPDGYFTPGELINISVDRTAGTPAAAGFGAGGAAAARGGLIVLNAIVLTDTTQADAQGSFSYSVTLPEEGDYTLIAAAADGTPAQPITARVVVDSEYATAGGTNGGTTGGTNGGTTGGTTGTSGGTTTAGKSGLANTGIDSAMLLWGAAGIGALGLGAGSIFVARRRSAEA